MRAQWTGLEGWSTEHLLAVYEKLFARLDPKTKQRLLETARSHGWDRTWLERAA